MESLTSPVKAAHPEGAAYGTVLDAEVALRFSTLDAEYEAIRERAALLDLSGERIIELSGRDAVEFAQKVLARDVEYLTAERCMTSLVLAEDGTVVDQVVVWGREDSLLLESSTGAGTRLLEHLRAHAEPGVEITDRTAEYALFGLEGPYAWGVVGRLIDGELASLPFESIVDTQWDGVDVLFGRTGVTGEYGYKVLVPRESAERLWTKALEHAVPAGQEAVELAMLEVRQPVVRHEAGEGVDVLEMGAGWLVDITKDEFVGRDAVVAAFEGTAERRTVGFSGGTEVPAPGTPVTVGGEKIGEVVHAVHSVGLKSSLGLLRLPPDLAAAGLTLTVGDTEVVTLTSPYVTPKSWSTPII
ncbi:aminomethyltransferase family protein [Lentzea jiangxiensis]|uniref:Aminomethyltransferase n=1 Tax=Lentzea jiangxiensis TaxID=641025 RepID=A0A1H0WYU1_9PSEU|nr:aminomethyltransferase family protein [Lentzea jiangxiensis]SDP95898.1 aminomethyltransferase [Lentzea jiangxiensis]